MRVTKVSSSSDNLKESSLQL